MDNEEWWENQSDMKRQGLEFEYPEDLRMIEAYRRKMKKKHGPRYNDMMDEARDIKEEMDRGGRDDV